MKRREFITLAGAAVAWPLAARAQQTKIRRLGVLSEGSISNHPTPSFRAFLETLREAGGIEGQNLKIEWRVFAGRAGSVFPRRDRNFARPAGWLYCGATTAPFLGQQETPTH